MPHDQADDLQVPADVEERSRWLLDGARRLADAVRQAGPRTSVWSWADDKTVGFWLRRITHDTLVHRLDAELAVGREVALAPVAWEHRHGRSGVTLRGPALDLLLVLSRRAAVGSARVEVTGDAQLLAHWLEHSRLDPA